MRIALIDRPDAVDRPAGENRFTALADLLTAKGHDVMLLNGAPDAEIGSPPILTGLNRAVSTSPMIDAHRLARHLADLHPDLVIAPLRGGIAQGVLMARACGEAFAATRVALWCDTPSHTRFLRADDAYSGISPLIADALERQGVTFADALIVPGETKSKLPSRFVASAPPSFEATLPVASTERAVPPPHPREIREIVFVGGVQRSNGVGEFIEAVHRLSRDGFLADRTVVFLGVVRPDVQGIGKDWMGLRAATWPFKFKVVDERQPDAIRHYLSEYRRLPVAIGDDREDLELLQRSGPHHVGLLRLSDSSAQLTSRLETALRMALSGTPSPSQASNLDAVDWGDLVDKLAKLPIRALNRPALPVGITVCVLHYNRLHALTGALASIPDVIGENPVEVLVLDNASDGTFIEDEIRALAGPRPHLRVIRLGKPVPQAFALNLGLAEARFDTVLFLDDDNAYLPGGVARLAQAVSKGGFDIAVTALEIFDDGNVGPATTAGRLIFLGEAHSAGLFFNAFGDTSMAVHRDAFLNIGGFHDPGYDYPALDWVTLAKAQAAGLRIGALQWPAIRYRRDIARADLAANKLDQEGARSFVFAAYGRAFDAELLARYAQKLHLEEL